MSIANYLINLDEMAEAIKNAYANGESFNLGKQRVYGLELECDNTSTQTVNWIVPSDIHIVGIKFGVNDCRNIGYEDSFNMYIDDEKVFDDVYIKEMYEYKRFRQHRPIKKDSIVSFEFNNRDNMKKHIWFDIHYADKDIQARAITIICVDKHTGKEIQRNDILVTVPFSGTITAPILNKYNVVGTDSYNVEIPVYSTKSPVLVFEYELSIVDITIICINKENGTELERKTITQKVPLNKVFNAPILNGYRVVGKDSEHLVMDSSNAEDTDIVFEYEIEPRKINIICIDRNTGAEIRRETIIEKPPIDMVFNAPIIDKYTLVGRDTATVKMDIENSRDVDVIFEYEANPVRITIVCINVEDGSEIYRTYVDKRPPIDEDIPAPSVGGYSVAGDTSKHISMNVSNSQDIELTFEYEPRIQDPDISHDYDWKFVMRWQSNCSTDLDLHGEFDDGTHVYYGSKENGYGNNMAWLDYDYTRHDGNNDREDKPEILTVLGAISDYIEIYIVPYAREHDLSEDVTLEIYKLENGRVNPLRVVTIPYRKFLTSDKVSVCQVNLRTDEIRVM